MDTMEYVWVFHLVLDDCLVSNVERKELGRQRSLDSRQECNHQIYKVRRSHTYARGKKDQMGKTGIPNKM